MFYPFSAIILYKFCSHKTAPLDAYISDFHRIHGNLGFVEGSWYVPWRMLHMKATFFQPHRSSSMLLVSLHLWRPQFSSQCMLKDSSRCCSKGKKNYCCSKLLFLSLQLGKALLPQQSWVTFAYSHLLSDWMRFYLLNDFIHRLI